MNYLMYSSNFIFRELLNLKEITDEFILRFPIVIFSVINLFLIYKISRKFLGKEYSLLLLIIIISEIWITYFSQYLRFYTPAITIFLSTFYLLINQTDSYKKFIYILIVNLL